MSLVQRRGIASQSHSSIVSSSNSTPVVSSPNSTSVDSSWAEKAVRGFKQIFIVDNLAKISIAASTAIGAYVASGSAHTDEMEGLGIAAIGTAVSCLLWGVGAALKGEKSKALTRIGISGALFATSHLALQQTAALNQAEENALVLKSHLRAYVSERMRLNEQLSAFNPVPCELQSFPTLKARISCRMEEVQGEMLHLKAKVSGAIYTGGILKPIRGSSSGLYVIKDKEANPIAVFKPENERIWGPQNPDSTKRKSDPSPDDIHFHKMSSFEQGQTAARQHLAKLLDFGHLLPSGGITELTSDQFVDLASEKSGRKPRIQTKMGYLQAWVPSAKPFVNVHPSVKVNLSIKGGLEIPEEAYRFEDNLFMDKISLDELQKIGLMDILLYNEDRHPENLLVSIDMHGVPHLHPIDCDTILPFRLWNLHGLYKHRRTSEPFTPEMLELISKLSPQYIEGMVKELNLGPQMAQNAKSLTWVVKEFAAAGLTMANIYRFVRSPSTDLEPTEPSLLWTMMVKANKEALESLSSSEKQRFEHAGHLRWVTWEAKLKGTSPSLNSEDRAFLYSYSQEDQGKIDQLVEKAYWKSFKYLLVTEIRNIRASNLNREKV